MVLKPENKRQQTSNHKEKNIMKSKQKVLIGGALALASLINTHLYAGEEVAVEDVAMQKLIRVLETNGTLDKKNAIKLREAVTVQDSIEAKRTQAAIDKAANGGTKERAFQEGSGKNS